ncbi:UNKNOWN [Stylonychia lemnae]|uniref:Uncharacterized protein n=1 Tax=Stylonychia lemnae TaxID=5949 RepID=A0A078ALZ9_STYLE|nr:UNKNOWN [Stylonychia lemnae]|eukprot:CDW83390.1 UNKNOWN [Stylonychia lemnae]
MFGKISPSISPRDRPVQYFSQRQSPLPMNPAPLIQNRKHKFEQIAPQNMKNQQRHLYFQGISPNIPRNDSSSTKITENSNSRLIDQKRRQAEVGKLKPDIKAFKDKLDDDLQKLQQFIDQAEEAQNLRRMSNSIGRRKSTLSPHSFQQQQHFFTQTSQAELINKNKSNQKINEDRVMQLGARQNMIEKIQHEDQSLKSQQSSYQSVNFTNNKNLNELKSIQLSPNNQQSQNIQTLISSDNDPLRIQMENIQRLSLGGISDKEEEKRILQMLTLHNCKINERYQNNDKPPSVISQDIFLSPSSTNQVSVKRLSNNQNQLKSNNQQKYIIMNPEESSYANNQIPFLQNISRENNRPSLDHKYNTIGGKTDSRYQNNPQAQYWLDNLSPQKDDNDEYFKQLRDLELQLEDINTINQKIIQENKKLQSKNKHISKKLVDVKCRLKQSENTQKSQDQYIASQAQKIQYLEDDRQRIYSNIQVQEEQIKNLKGLLSTSQQQKFKYENIFKKLIDNDQCREIVLSMLKI